MKKLIIAAFAIAAFACTSCNNEVKAELGDRVDTLTNYLGIAQASSLKQYMELQLRVDSTYIEEFIKGVIEGATTKEDPKQEAYLKGLEVGKQTKGMADNLSREVYADDTTKQVPIKNLLAGLISGLKGEAGISEEEAYTKFNEILKTIQDEKWVEWKKQNEDFLANNVKNAGVKVLPSGLQYKVLVEGNGALPTDTTTVRCHYEGKLIDGKIFDSSYERGEPFSVNMAMPRVISGWVEALKLMPVGSKWEVYIPQALGYGDRQMGDDIKPYSTLIFTIEIL